MKHDSLRHTLHKKTWLNLALIGLFGVSVPMTALFAQTLPSMGAPASPRQDTPPITTPSAPTATLGVQGAVPSVSSGGAALVRDVRFTGNSAYSADELKAVISDKLSQPLDINGMLGLADLITRHYRKNGYLVAKAYLPPQNSSNGQLLIEVLEGRIGAVRVEQLQGHVLSTQRVQGMVNAAMCEGQIANQGDACAANGKTLNGARVDRALLLLKDLPGVTASGALSPGNEPGTSDLTIELKPSRSHNTSIDLDNYGSKTLGHQRVGLTHYQHNLSNRGDQLTINWLRSTAANASGGVVYSLPLGYMGTRLGLAYARGQFRLGADLAATESFGTSNASSLYLQQPLVRQINRSVYGRVSYEAGNSNASVSGQRFDTSGNVIRANVSGDNFDTLGRGGYNVYSLGLSSGRLNLAPQNISADAQGAQTNGDWSKLSYSYGRQQNINDSLTLYGAVTGQHSQKNLAGAEQMGLGGATGVRAYPWGEGAGSVATLLNLELRKTHGLNTPWGSNARVTIALFFDWGVSDYYAKIYPNITQTHRLMRSAGLTVAQESRTYYLRFVLATHPIAEPSRVETGSSSNTRAWLQTGFRY